MKPWSRASKPAPPSLPAPALAPTKPPTEDMQKNEVVNIEQMCKLPFNCLFWIKFQLKFGALGLVLRVGPAVQYSMYYKENLVETVFETENLIFSCCNSSIGKVRKKKRKDHN